MCLRFSYFYDFKRLLGLPTASFLKVKKCVLGTVLEVSAMSFNFILTKP